LRRLLFIYKKLDLRWANESTAITSSCFKTAKLLLKSDVRGKPFRSSGRSVPRAKAENEDSPLALSSFCDESYFTQGREWRHLKALESHGVVGSLP